MAPPQFGTGATFAEESGRSPSRLGSLQVHKRRADAKARRGGGSRSCRSRARNSGEELARQVRRHATQQLMHPTQGVQVQVHSGRSRHSALHQDEAHDEEQVPAATSRATPAEALDQVQPRTVAMPKP